MPIHQTNDDLRKAAILIDSLDQQAADALLDQMEPPQADRVRRALLSLGDVAEDERDLVIAQFLGRREAPSVQPERPDSAMDDSGIEIDESLAARFVTDDREVEEEPPPPPSPAMRFQFLGEADGEMIVPFLRDENPQAIAVVLAHLPPERAADVLSRLAPALQAEVVRRIVHLDATSPEVLRDVEQELGSRLFDQLQKLRRRTAGVTAMRQILGATDVSNRQNLLAILAGNDTAMAEQLLASYGQDESPPTSESVAGRSGAGRDRTAAGAATFGGSHGHATAGKGTNRREADPPTMTKHPPNPARDPGPTTNDTPRPPTFKFDDLARLSDDALTAVFAPVAVDLAELALVGADEQLVRRVLRRMPAAKATAINARLRRLGPMRLSDVERAQQEIARIADRLVRCGRIEPAGSRPPLAMTA
jgi:flagellar motor switch protein FliG